MVSFFCRYNLFAYVSCLAGEVIYCVRHLIDDLGKRYRLTWFDSFVTALSGGVFVVEKVIKMIFSTHSIRLVYFVDNKTHTI